MPRAGRFEVVEIEQPRPRAKARAAGGSHFPATSLYLANGAAIVPAFEDPQDSRASELFQKLFQGREVVQVPARELALAGVGLRAIALAQPAGTIAAA